MSGAVPGCPGAGCEGGDPRPDSESVIAMVKSTERDLGLPHKLCEGAAQQWQVSRAR